MMTQYISKNKFRASINDVINVRAEVVSKNNVVDSFRSDWLVTMATIVTLFWFVEVDF